MRRYSGRYIDPDRQCRRWIDPRVMTLPLGDVLAYLQSRGWKQLPTDREHFLVFQEPTQDDPSREPFCVFAPDAEDYDIYGQVIFELITGIAEYEKRWASAIIDDMVGAAGRNGDAAPDPARAGPSREVPTS